MRDVDKYNNIDDLAALMSVCDEVIGYQNCANNISGSIGVNTKVLLNCFSSWMYPIEDEKCYWFDSNKIYRQTKHGDWDPALKKIKLDILN